MVAEGYPKVLGEIRSSPASFQTLTSTRQLSVRDASVETLREGIKPCPVKASEDVRLFLDGSGSRAQWAPTHS